MGKTLRILGYLKSLEKLRIKILLQDRYRSKKVKSIKNLQKL